MRWFFRRGETKDETAAAIEQDVANIKVSEADATKEGEAPATEYTPADEDDSRSASPIALGGHESNVSEQEKLWIAAMKAKLNPDVKPGVPLDVGLDFTLLRFIRARKGDVDGAIEAYTKMVEWRKETGVDKMLIEEDPNEHVFQCICPHRHHGCDREGHPIYIERTGMIRVNEVVRHTSEEDIVTRHVRFMEKMIERMIASSQNTNKYVGKMVLIHDMTGMRYTIEPAGFRIFRKTTHIDQTYYPECLKSMIIINAPLSFRGVWAIIKPWLDPKTRTKVEIYGTNFHARLAELIAPEELPEIYGGTCTCEGKYDNGDSCLNIVRTVQKDPSIVPPPWPKVDRRPTDLEGGPVCSPIVSSPAVTPTSPTPAP